ncbi:DUF317 domain-containing protein [Streptomyces sp. NBC_00690]|uniref:DUF317 domain-containing protein n=1 Tax=Streptomyces sp. NBC_00690 TaxID=2975808 RepID=UPI002E2BEBBF|nr:DUF317 domain-containing protein [Streptomyces sp. NBC_00690]
MTVPSAPGSIEVDFIAPRHLAGSGDPAWITVPLHRAAGWSHGHDPLMPRVILSSPGQKALLRLEPASDSQWWNVHHAADAGRPAWYANFGARTPVETIAGFIDALTHPHCVPAEPDPYAPLLAAGWLPARDHGGLTSPDGFAHFEGGGDDTWTATTTVGEDPENRLWQARFSDTAPRSLIAGFTRALADPAPLARDLLRLSPAAWDRAQVTFQSVPAGTLASALERRIQQLTAPASPRPVTGPRPPKAPPPPRR